MIDNGDVKTNLHSHSEAKVELLGKYLKRYLSIISNDGYTEKINVYDLFCGIGEYENGGEGSPLVALRQIKDTYYKLIANKYVKKPKIDCYFNDIESAKLEILKEAIHKKSLYYPHIGKLEFSSNDYLDEVDRLSKLFKSYKNEKSFVFIDPYGYKEVKPEHIKKLLDCNMKSEVLLWQPIQFMYRFSNSETPEALKNIIEELGISKEESNFKNVWHFIDVLKSAFQNYLGRSCFVDNFALKKNENTIFCLFFFTSHIKGFEKMLEAKWEIDAEQGKCWEYSGNNPNLFSEQKTNELADRLEEYIQNGKRTNGDVYEFTLREGYLPKHTNEVFIDWQSRNKLLVEALDGSKVRKRAFYVSYKYYKSKIDYSKVSFKVI